MSEFKITEGQFLGIHNVLLKYQHRLEKLEKKENRRVWQKGFMEGFKIAMQFQVGQKPKLEIKAGIDPTKK